MKLNKLHYTVEDGIAVVQLDYPKNLNAIDEEMADELLYVVQAAEADESVKVVVFKGLPRAFSAGGDIGYFYQLIKAGGDVNMDGLIGKVGKVTDGLKKMSKMVIASVSGAAAGAGASLALTADFIIAVKTLSSSWPSSIWAWSPIRAVPISWSNSWGRNGPWTSALPDAL